MHAVHLFLFFPRFVFVLPPHLSRIRGNHEHESTLLFVSRLGRNFLVKENEIRIDFFFLFFLFFLSNHVLAKKIDDRISRDGRFLRDINLSNLNLLSFSTVCLYIYRTYASTGGYVTSTFNTIFQIGLILLQIYIIYLYYSSLHINTGRNS